MPERKSQTAKIWNKKNSCFAKKKNWNLLQKTNEIHQALHFLENGCSFSSIASDSVRFDVMFPDSQIAKRGKYRIFRTIRRMKNL